MPKAVSPAVEQAAHARVRRAKLYLSPKGGVGKSTIARTDLDLSRAGTRSVAAFDLDANTGSFSLVYADKDDPMVGVRQDQLRPDKSAWMQHDASWSDAIANADADDVIIDIPGGGLMPFLARLVGSNPPSEDLSTAESLDFARRGVRTLLRLAERSKREIVAVSVIGILEDSFTPAQDVFRVFEQHAHHVVVKNGFFADHPEHFIMFDGLRVGNEDIIPRSKTRKDADAINAEIIFVPRLPEIPQQLAAYWRLSYIDASHDEEKMKGALSADQMRSWLDTVARNMRGTWLDPAGPPIPERNANSTGAREVAAT